MLKYCALILPVVALAPFVALAADPAGFEIYKAQELKGYQKKLSPKVDAAKLAGQSLGKFGNHTTSVSHREGSGSAEVHEGVTDIFVIESGAANLVIGGKVAQAKTTSPGEIRGTSIEGGSRHPVAPGDIVHIPAKVPHQFLLDAGQHVTYFVIKVDAK